ncbi:Microtubule-associated protein Jupiter [Gryllus bimaculatus]|nr:Microtubule-associated protein Jupiter [Gryllus bimaculatus]
MTSTNVNIGLRDESKNSSRVLKPPGGGTSDIFGAPDPVQNSPRRVRNNMQSSVFGPPPTNGEITPRSKMGCDSYNRLFGPADSRPQSATKNRLKSSIILSNDAASSPPKDNNSNSPIKEISAVDGVSTKVTKW